MIVYIITEEPYHDNSTVHGAYASLEAAEASESGGWLREGYYVSQWRNVVSEHHDEKGEMDLLIREFELQGESK